MTIRRNSLSIAIASVLASGSALADPPVSNPDIPPVFCFRITDIERPTDAYDNGNPVTGTLVDDDRFLVEFEVLNWTGSPATGLNMSLNAGSSDGVTLAGAGIDRDGRGGSVGDASDPRFGEIDYVRDGTAGGTADATPHQSGRGNSGFDNDWQVTARDTTSALFDAQVSFVDDFDGYGGYGGGFAEVDGTPITNEDLISQVFGFGGRVPGLGTDETGDTAIDGGPGVDDADADVSGFGDNLDQTQAGNLPTAFVSGESPLLGEGNVLDGFVLEVDGLGVGDTLSLNWFLLGTAGVFGDGDQLAVTGVDGYGGGAVDCDANPLDCFFPLGTAGFGNEFGFGTFTLGNLGEGGDLPGPLFQGNSGLNQNPVTFFDEVWDLPNPTDFGAEFGVGQTAAFVDDDDNIFGAQVNTQSAAVPEPTTLALAGLGGLALGLRRRRRSP